MGKSRKRQTTPASEAKAMVLIPLYRQRIVEDGKRKAGRKPTRRALMDAASRGGDRDARAA